MAVHCLSLYLVLWFNLSYKPKMKVRRLVFSFLSRFCVYFLCLLSSRACPVLLTQVSLLAFPCMELERSMDHVLFTHARTYMAASPRVMKNGSNTHQLVKDVYTVLCLVRSNTACITWIWTGMYLCAIRVFWTCVWNFVSSRVDVESWNVLVGIRSSVAYRRHAVFPCDVSTSWLRVFSVTYQRHVLMVCDIKMYVEQDGLRAIIVDVVDCCARPRYWRRWWRREALVTGSRSSAWLNDWLNSAAWNEV